MPGPIDLRLYLVTDSELCAGRGVGATVAAAVEGGVTAVQVRDPRATARALFDLSRDLVAMLSGTGVAVVVNDRLDVALAAGAAGAHLGQSDLPPVEARRIAGPAAVIGWSVTNLAQARAAAALPPGTLDYLGVGPVYATSTKPDAAAPLGPELMAGLVEVAADSGLACVAIGGIDRARAAAVMARGAVGVAVISAICGAADPGAAARALRREVVL